MVSVALFNFYWIAVHTIGLSRAFKWGGLNQTIETH